MALLLGKLYCANNETAYPNVSSNVFILIIVNLTINDPTGTRKGRAQDTRLMIILLFRALSYYF